MKTLITMLAVIGFAVGCAQSPTSDELDASTITTSKDEGIICHNEVETGSRIKSKRVCTTRAEREQRALEVREAKEAMRRSRSLTPDPASDSSP